MALTDTLIKHIKQRQARREKYADGGGMYLLINQRGKYWRMDYRFAGKRKTVALGVYPAVSLAKARRLGSDARAAGGGQRPQHEQREAKQIKAHRPKTPSRPSPWNGTPPRRRLVNKPPRHHHGANGEQSVPLAGRKAADGN